MPIDTHVWAQTYDRPLDENAIFEIQSDLATEVAAAVGGGWGAIARRLRPGLEARPIGSLETYECSFLLGGAYATWDAALHLRSRDCFERIAAESPDNAAAWANLALIAIGEHLGMNPRPGAIERMIVHAAKAIDLDPMLNKAHYSMGYGYFLSREPGKALAAFDHAVRLNPNDVAIIGGMSLNLVLLGDRERGLALARRALALDPFAPAYVRNGIFHAHAMDGDWQAALASMEAVGKDTGHVWQYLHMAIALVQLDRVEEARAMVARAREVEPEIDVNARVAPENWWWAIPETRKVYVEALAQAGLDLGAW